MPNQIISECSKLSQIEYKIRLDWGQGDPLWIVQEIKIWPYEQIVDAQPRICPAEWDAQTPLGLWDTNGSPYLDRTTRP